MAEPQEFIIVEAPDGTEIEFPSTMSDDEISNVMRQQFPPGGVPQQFLDAAGAMGIEMPTQEQFRNQIIPDQQARGAGFDYTMRKMGERIIERRSNDPENIGWTPGGRSPQSFAANKLGLAEGTYLGWGDDVIGLFNAEAGQHKEDLKRYARNHYPQEFSEGQVEGNIFNALTTAPVSAPRALQVARFMPRGTQGITAGATSAVAWDTADQMGTGYGDLEDRFQNLDTDRTKFAAGVGGTLGGVLSVFTRTLSNGQSEFARVLEGVVDDAGSISDDGVRSLERFLSDNGVALDDVSFRLIHDVVQEGREVPSKALALPMRIKDILIDAFEDGTGAFTKAIETQLRGTMVEGGDGAARIAESVDEDFREARTALDAHYGDRLGQKARIKSEDETLTRLREIGDQGYEPVLGQDLSYQDVRALDEVMNGPGMEKLRSPLEEIAAGEGLSLADMIATQPLRAAHWMQSKARQLAQSKTDEVMASAFTSLRRRLLNVIEEVAPEYRQIRQKYGDEFGNLEALEFGDRFLSSAGKAFEIDKMARAYSRLSAAQKRVALLSVRDVLRAASGRGNKNAPPRLSRVGDEQVLDALETVFGARGARVAQGIEDVQQFVRSRTNVDSRRGSPTAPNQEAAATARSAVQSPLRRKIGNALQSLAGDAAFTSAGLPAVNTIRGSVARVGRSISGDVSDKMNALANVLEARVATQAAERAPRPTPIRGPDGRFISNEKARELGLLDDGGEQVPQNALSAPEDVKVNGIPGSVNAEIGGAAVGASVGGGASVEDLNGDGKITIDEMFTPSTIGGAVIGGLSGAAGAHIGKSTLPPGTRGNGIFINDGNVVSARRGSGAPRADDHMAQIGRNIEEQEAARNALAEPVAASGGNRDAIVKALVASGAIGTGVIGYDQLSRPKAATEEAPQSLGDVRAELMNDYADAVSRSGTRDNIIEFRRARIEQIDKLIAREEGMPHRQAGSPEIEAARERLISDLIRQIRYAPHDDLTPYYQALDEIDGLASGNLPARAPSAPSLKPELPIQ